MTDTTPPLPEGLRAEILRITGGTRWSEMEDAIMAAIAVAVGEARPPKETWEFSSMSPLVAQGYNQALSDYSDNLQRMMGIGE